jgi:hypothetical protein
MQGISPLTAINRKLGLPDDHGVDAINSTDQPAAASA